VASSAVWVGASWVPCATGCSLDIAFLLPLALPLPLDGDNSSNSNYVRVVRHYLIDALTPAQSSTLAQGLAAARTRMIIATHM